ncbi:adherens junction-associated protein 1 [Notechis scutatus]|uniref:Adherens junction-associated protein 1 n=1 Tax=Notechis scutatus TaxID=8663 RepID=A0A6J1VN44_9SAUR|nr:adherens junction-associated protein 1 [Notechis scutatus]
MFRLAMEVSSCASLGRDLRHPFPQRPARWYGFPHHLLWSFRYGPQVRRLGLPASLDYLELSNGQWPNVSRLKRWHHVADLWWGSWRTPSLGHVKANPTLTGKRTVSQAYLKRRKRYLRANSRPTMETEVIVWGSTSPLEALETSTIPGIYNGPATSVLERVTSSMTTTTTVSTTTTAASTTDQSKGLGPGLGSPKNPPISTLLPPSTSRGSRKKAEGPPPAPPKLPGDTSGLALHQIITITVSLIMVIAALITTLVLKNCCAQRGNARRSGHQRKIKQQEESCQNLTDFTPARVPSNLDIFTAYNETLQCSHECVRSPVPMYAEEAMLSPGDYKTSFNGNRGSSSDRHLIPVAFVSEKWFEISC